LLRTWLSRITGEDKKRLRSVKILSAISGRKLFFLYKVPQLYRGKAMLWRIYCQPGEQKKPLPEGQGPETNYWLAGWCQPPQDPDPQEPELQPPPPTGFVEVMEKPER